MTLNWHKIRPIGSQAHGFEELCAQLARAESPDLAQFVRKGSPDAGVECYCVIPDGSEWGWQAKYFDSIGTTQWSQLDKSVKKALNKHPALVRYFVCIPLDRSDARIHGKKSAMQNWNDRVNKWRCWSREQNMNVEFVWWGSSELIERLSQNEHIGRRYFWFDQQGFDKDWFQDRLDEAVKAAGPRYTPEIHVDIPIARDLEIFSRSKFIFEELKSLAKGIRRAYQGLESSSRSEEYPNRAISFQPISALIENILNRIAQIEPEPIRELPFIKISEMAASAVEKVDKIAISLDQLQYEYLEKHRRQDAATDYHQMPFSNSLSYIKQLQNELEKARCQFERADSLASGRLMLLMGKAGTGKTHLLCDFAEKRIVSQAPTILLMGQRFLNTDTPWTQLLQQLDLSGVSAAEFTGALESVAQTTNCRALLIIDALNEGQGRLLWPPNLAAFLKVFEKSPWIGVLLSVRSNFEEVVIPEEIRNRAVPVIHHGFDDIEYDATRAFFSHYDLEFPSTPILQPEFCNPLLLKTICLGLKDSGQRRFPRGFHGITTVFDLFLQAINKRLAERLNFNPNDELVREALEELAKHFIRTDRSWLERRKAETLVNDFLPNREFEQSLYRGLVVEGILTEDANIGSEIVYISYERYADHIIANSLLSNHLDAKAPQSAFEEGAALAFIYDKSKSVSPGLMEALCIQVPERVNQELVMLAPALVKRWEFGEAFRQSIIWRNPNAISESTREIFNQLIQNSNDMYDALEVLLTVATVENHPLNAEFLDEKLRRNSMPDRDAYWSTYLHHAWGTRGAVDRLVDWASAVKEDSSLDERTVGLCSITLAWMLTTSNRFLRDRATKALVSLLTGRLDETKRLVDRFVNVNDPYVTERIYAVAYGVAMRSHDAVGIGKLALLVYERVFAGGTPPVHILLRDYARGVVERANYLWAELDVKERLNRPPYNSTWPKIPDEDEIQRLLSDPPLTDDSQKFYAARREITSSVMSGDFGRYVIGRHSNWLSLRLNEPPWKPKDHGRDRPLFDPELIQRYVIQRVFDFGWTTDRFGEFDQSVRGRGLREASKPERIGKKYQWIAYHEILAYIADHYQYRELHRGNDTDQIYEGPWQNSFRDIDPSCSLPSIPGGTSWLGNVSSWWCPVLYDNWNKYPNHRDWISSKDDLPSVEKLLSVTNPTDGTSWLNLDGDFWWQQPLPANVDPLNAERKDLWLNYTAFFLHAEDCEAFMDWAKTVDFSRIWMLNPAKSYRIFFGEYGWSPAYRHDYGVEGWLKPDVGCPVPVLPATFHYEKESGCYDCSVNETYTLRLPTQQLIESLGLKWHGNGADYADRNDKPAAFDPTVYAEGPNALLIRKDMLRQYLKDEGLALCWTIEGNKEGGKLANNYGRWRFSGAYKFTDTGLEGYLRSFTDIPEGDAT